jgi:hypothetical protein
VTYSTKSSFRNPKIYFDVFRNIPGNESEPLLRQLLFDRSYRFNESHIMGILTIFEQYRLSQDIEAVANILWKVS